MMMMWREGLRGAMDLAGSFYLLSDDSWKVSLALPRMFPPLFAVGGCVEGGRLSFICHTCNIHKV